MVFSSLRYAVLHLEKVLAYEGIEHVVMLKGDSQASLQAAMRRWKNDATCQVFLLHAEAAAAGITLTSAQHVFLMEPFLDHGTELQALTRCHRACARTPLSPLPPPPPSHRSCEFEARFALLVQASVSRRT